ncbi:MAG: hypothetical protein QOC73_2061 [Actinomycetota bacterium]|nr:hypothetical protein [Actinomycetota bacterium]MDQ1494648.1 hypothetical protein [Actinomycetota bacterium]MDQ1541381.1 hypothetical protein [Actinomycetota bacterium]
MKRTESALPDFEEFVSEAGRGLLRFAHVLTLERFSAEDLTQDTLVRVGLAWSRVRPDGNPVAYSRKTMVNLFLNGRRRARELPSGSASDVADTTPSRASTTDPAMNQVDDAQLVRELLRRLSPKQRSAVALRYLLDLPDSEIAAWLGCSEPTVRSQISRGLATMRREPNVGATTSTRDGCRHRRPRETEHGSR